MRTTESTSASVAPGFITISMLVLYSQTPKKVQALMGLHSFGNRNSQRSQSRSQLSPGYVSGHGQDSLLNHILFNNDTMAMIKKIEGSCERECVFRQIGWFSRACCLSHHFFESFGQQHERPHFGARF